MIYPIGMTTIHVRTYVRVGTAWLISSLALVFRIAIVFVGVGLRLSDLRHAFKAERVGVPLHAGIGIYGQDVGGHSGQSEVTWGAAADASSPSSPPTSSWIQGSAARGSQSLSQTNESQRKSFGSRAEIQMGCKLKEKISFCLPRMVKFPGNQDN